MFHLAPHITLNTSTSSLSPASPVLLSSSSPNPDPLSTYPLIHCHGRMVLLRNSTPPQLRDGFESTNSQTDDREVYPLTSLVELAPWQKRRLGVRGSFSTLCLSDSMEVTRAAANCLVYQRNCQFKVMSLCRACRCCSEWSPSCPYVSQNFAICSLRSACSDTKLRGGAESLLCIVPLGCAVQAKDSSGSPLSCNRPRVPCVCVGSSR